MVQYTTTVGYRGKAQTDTSRKRKKHQNTKNTSFLVIIQIIKLYLSNSLLKAAVEIIIIK